MIECYWIIRIATPCITSYELGCSRIIISCAQVLQAGWVTLLASETKDRTVAAHGIDCIPKRVVVFRQCDLIILIHQLARRAERIGEEVIGGRGIDLRWWTLWATARSAKLSAKRSMHCGKGFFYW